MQKPIVAIAPFALALSLLWVGCGTPAPAPVEEAPPVDMSALTAQIQAMEDAYAAGEIAKDVDAVVAYYADDVVSYNHNEEPTVGKQALRQRLADRMAKDTTGHTPTFKVIEIFPGDGFVTEVGSWSMADPTGAVKDKGTYFSVFRKDGENWTCIRDISVSSLPKEKAMAGTATQ